MKEILDINYVGDNNERHLLDVFLPENEGFTTYLYFHGGGIESGSKAGMTAMKQSLTDAGFAVVMANYRLYPNAKFPEFIEDAATAAVWVKKNIKNYGGNGKVVIGGSSAGAYLSLMLCFDEHYLENAGTSSKDIDGWIFDAGQPTTHFNVLRERGIDTRRVIVDEAGPLYHIKQYEKCSPMVIFAAENDMPGRLEQNNLLIKTLKIFGYPEENIYFEYMPGFSHCQYVGEECYRKKVLEFLEKIG